MPATPDQDEGDTTWSPVPDDANHEGDLASRFSRGFEPVTKGDWILVGIALLDVLLLLARDVYGDALPPFSLDLIVWIDLGILAFFAIEFVVEMERASSRLLYARNHWYELVGMIPVAHWGIRVFRLVRLLRMYVVMSYPTELEPDRDWSYALVRGIIIHYRNVLLEEITDPIVLTSLDVIEAPLVRSRFAETVGRSIDERREHIHTVVEDAVLHTRGLHHLARTQYGRHLIRTVTETTLETTIHTLESEELNEVISASIEDVIEEIRSKVRQKEYDLEGRNRFRPTFSE